MTNDLPTREQTLSFLRSQVEVCERAAPGPWHRKDAFNIECDECHGEMDAICRDCCDEEENTAYIQVCGMESFAEPNSRFIIDSRTNYPASLRACIAVLEKPPVNSAARFIDQREIREAHAEQTRAWLAKEQNQNDT